MTPRVTFNASEIARIEAAEAKLKGKVENAILERDCAPALLSSGYSGKIKKDAESDLCELKLDSDYGVSPGFKYWGGYLDLQRAIDHPRAEDANLLKIRGLSLREYSAALNLMKLRLEMRAYLNRAERLIQRIEKIRKLEITMNTTPEFCFISCGYDLVQSSATAQKSIEQFERKFTEYEKFKQDHRLPADLLNFAGYLRAKPAQLRDSLQGVMLQAGVYQSMIDEYKKDPLNYCD